MKLLIITTLMISFHIFGKEPSFKDFNKTLNQDIETTLQDNPQLYETKPMRMPASVSDDVILHKKAKESKKEHLDVFDPQQNGNIDW